MSLKDLKALVKIGEKIKIREVEVTVNEFTLSDLPEISKIVTGITFERDNIPQAILSNIDSFYKIVSLSTGENVEDIKKYLTIDEFVELASKVVEVNLHLFLQKVMPKLEVLSKEIASSIGQK